VLKQKREFGNKIQTRYNIKYRICVVYIIQIFIISGQILKAKTWNCFSFKTSLFAHTHIQTLQSFLASFRLGLDWSVFAFFTIFNQIKTSQICNLHWINFHLHCWFNRNPTEVNSFYYTFFWSFQDVFYDFFGCILFFFYIKLFLLQIDQKVVWQD